MNVISPHYDRAAVVAKKGIGMVVKVVWITVQLGMVWYGMVVGCIGPKRGTGLVPCSMVW